MLCSYRRVVFYLFVVSVSVLFNGDLFLVDGIFISSVISVEVIKYSFTDLKSACCLEETLK